MCTFLGEYILKGVVADVFGRGVCKWGFRVLGDIFWKVYDGRFSY